MKRWITTLGAILTGALLAVGAPVPPVEPPPDDSAGQSPALRTMLSDRPFFGTQSLLTLNGTYVNTPMENYQQTGLWDKWDLPLSLEDMRGMITEISFGNAARRGQSDFCRQLADAHALDYGSSLMNQSPHGADSCSAPGIR